MSTPSTPSIPHRYPDLSSYLTTRRALVTAENSLSYTSTTDPRPLEPHASALLNRLKTHDTTTTTTTTTSPHPRLAQGHKHLHSPFRDALSSATHVLQAACRAPKGALLHCHLDAMLPPQLLLADARGRRNLFVRAGEALVGREGFEGAVPEVRVLGKEAEAEAEAEEADVDGEEGEEREKGEGEGDLFSRAYRAGRWMRYSRFLERFPGGAAEAEEWMCSKVVLSAADAYHPEQTVDGIWANFKRAFMVLRGLTGYVSAYRNHFTRVLWHFARDGIHYAEIRVPLHANNFTWADDGSRQLSHKEMIQILADVLESEVPKIRAEGLVFWGAKFIYGCMRAAERKDMEWCMNDCIELKQAFPDLICGFDMQGQEDDGHTHLHWIKELLAMRAKCDELGLDLPFIFHAGETLDHGGDTDSNLYDAILLGTKRIGHGFSLVKHPLLMQLCKERNIAIETCPISNEVLGLTPSGIKNHPLPILLAHCVPCTINSDDPGCWEASLSHDFYQTLVGSNKMSLIGWRVLAEWSFEYSCMGEKEKEEGLKVFHQKWDEYCQWIIDTYEPLLAQENGGI